jgi:hypothetical protein
MGITNEVSDGMEREARKASGRHPPHAASKCLSSDAPACQNSTKEPPTEPSQRNKDKKTGDGRMGHPPSL